MRTEDRVTMMRSAVESVRITGPYIDVRNSIETACSVASSRESHARMALSGTRCRERTARARAAVETWASC